MLDPDQQFVFEFRHTSWYCPEVYQVLAENDWCLANIHAIAGPHAEGKSWLGELPDGSWPRTEAETPPCSWGFYRRLHGTAGQVCPALENSDVQDLKNLFTAESSHWRPVHATLASRHGMQPDLKAVCMHLHSSEAEPRAASCNLECQPCQDVLECMPGKMQQQG